MSYRIILIWLLSVPFIAKLAAQQPAFPGAEGFGRYARGGRGGLVVEVTNLNDAGSGSLRQALTSNINQKRTIVFRVSGTIELLSEIRISWDSFITVAGQTAPGDGICIKNYPITIDNSHDIIIRFLRFRPGDIQDCSSPDCDDIDAMSVRTSHDIILDHCSFSWSIDANLDLTHETGLSTVQYCILSEALLNSKHSKGAHSMAAGWDGQGGASYHHNLIASCNSRTPRLDAYLGQISGERDLIDIANNVIYNWAGFGAYGGENADANWRNNYYRYGPSTGGSTGGKKDQIFQVDGTCKMYLNGNISEGYPSVTQDNSKGIYIQGRHANKTQLDTILVAEPFAVESILIDSPEECFNKVLAQAGAIYPVRDSVDSRIVKDVNQRTGAIINSPEEVGGWPVLTSLEAPADGDHDGMPDDWETSMDLNPGDPADRNLDPDGDGYTNLEEYLNGLVPDPVFLFRPLNLEVERTGDLSLKLSWVDVSENENEFILERSSGEEFQVIGTGGANDTTYLDTVPDFGNYTYRIRARNEERESYYTYSGAIRIRDASSLYSQKIVSGFSCYPNPFHSRIHLDFNLPGASRLNITVHDLGGKCVAELSDGHVPEGRYQLDWDGRNKVGTAVEPGAYILRIRSGQGTFSRLVLKY